MKKNLNQWKKPLLLLLFLIVAIVMVPKLFSGYKLKVINISLIYSLLVLSLTIILGMGGQMSFAAIPFMGLGAYTVANFCSGRLGFYLNPVVALLVAIVGVGIFGFLLGLILMKLKGVFFTFSTIAFAQVALSFFSQYRPLFGGPDGINKIETLYIGTLWFDTPVKWFYLMLVLVVVAALIVERIRATKFGRSLACIRDNNTAALTLGVDTYMTRVYAFTCQAVIAALAGGIYTPDSGRIFLDEKDITAVPAHKRARLGIGRTFQTPRLLQKSNIRDNLMVGTDLASHHGYIYSFFHAFNKDFEREFHEYMELAGFEVALEKDISSLTFGQRKLFEIVRSLLGHPKVMLVDEPAAGLNDKEAEHAVDLIKLAASRNIGVLFIEHSMDMIMSTCDTIEVLNFGEVIASGTPVEVSSNQDVIDAYLGKDDAE